MGKDWVLGKVEGGRLFHGSPSDLPVGTILVPGSLRNFKQSSSEEISITSDPGRALYWAREASGGVGEFVYEVEPLGPVSAHLVGLTNFGQAIVLWEGRVCSARIIGRIVPAPSPS